MFRWLKNFFVPHEGNTYRPHSLKKSVVATVLVVAVILEVGAIAFLAVPNFAAKLNYLAAVLPGALIAKANETRVEQNLNELIENPILTHAAQIKANDMAARGYFAHVDPDGHQPWHYLDLAGYQYESAGENLAVNFSDSSEVHRAWMNSPTHKANIVRPQFDEIGIGIARGEYKGKNVIFVVQFFGVPKEMNAVATITPTPEVAPATQPVTIEAALETIETSDTELVSSIPTADETPVNEVALLDSPLQAEVEGASTEEQVTNTQEVAYQKPNTLAMLASAPRTTILYILIGLASLIFISLVLKIAIARHIQHKDLILHGVLLLIVIITGIIFNMLLSDYFGEITHVNNEKSLISIR